MDGAARRSDAALDRPMSIYEVHPGSWRRNPAEGNRPLTWRELAAELVPYVKRLGFTHIELMPVMEHPFDGSWGYQVTGYFAPTSRASASPDDFRYFVDECHLHGIGVLLDWVPGHFPKDAHGLARFDGTALFEHEDPRQGEHQDWGTLIFNYGRHEVRNFLIANALYWLESFHIDGLRVDAVASMIYLDYSREAGEWVPNRYGGRENLDAIDFLRELNTLTHEHAAGHGDDRRGVDGVSRGEPADVGRRPGVHLKWNMGWMHDILTYVSKDPVYRRWEHQHLTFSMLYAWNENFILPFSHDEVVHGKGAMIDEDAGRRVAEGGHAAHALCVHVRASRARSCCSWAASSASGASGTTTRRSTGICWSSRCTPGCSSFVEDLNRALPCASPRSTKWTSSRRASSGSTATTTSRA